MRSTECHSSLVCCCRKTGGSKCSFTGGIFSLQTEDKAPDLLNTAPKLTNHKTVADGITHGVEPVSIRPIFGRAIRAVTFCTEMKYVKRNLLVGLGH